jgi:thiol-disulfide isomerase/thioredoxin
MAGEGSLHAGNRTVLYFFWGNGCPHCERERTFLEQLAKRHPELEIKSFEVWYDLENAGLFAEMAKAYEKKIEGVPCVFIGNSGPLVGYLSDEVTGTLIEQRVIDCITKGCSDPQDLLRRTERQPDVAGKEIPARSSPSEKQPEPRGITKQEPGSEESPVTGERSGGTRGTKETVPAAPERETIRLPFLGEVDVSATSLPVLTHWSWQAWTDSIPAHFSFSSSSSASLCTPAREK